MAWGPQGVQVHSVQDVTLESEGDVLHRCQETHEMGLPAGVCFGLTRLQGVPIHRASEFILLRLKADTARNLLDEIARLRGT